VTKAGSPVLNKELWEPLAEMLRSKQVTWQHVGGQVGIPGNERVDVIATSFADGAPVQLYEGGGAAYPVDLTLREGQMMLSDKKDRSKQKAYSYLSYVHGVVARHKTWVSCETRVRGVAAAKYRKALSAEDEREIVTSWGASPDDIADAE
jgi:ribonuclease HI